MDINPAGTAASGSISEAPIEVPATVVARWTADRALLRSGSGSAVPVDVPPSLQHQVDVGTRAWMVVDALGSLLHWRLDRETA